MPSNFFLRFILEGWGYQTKASARAIQEEMAVGWTRLSSFFGEAVIGRFTKGPITWLTGNEINARYVAKHRQSIETG